jgi:hypothetical protein
MIETSDPARRVIALPMNDVILFRQVVLEATIEVLVLEIEYRVLVADGRLEQSLRVVGRRGFDHFQTRRVHEEGFRVEGVERTAPDARARRPADDHRQTDALPVAAVRGVVGEHVEPAGNEVDELHFRDRAEAHHRRAAGGPDDGGFRNGRIDDAHVAEFFEQARRDLERPAVLGDVLADAEHVRVAPHFFKERLSNRFEVGCKSHRKTMNDER